MYKMLLLSATFSNLLAFFCPYRSFSPTFCLLLPLPSYFCLCLLIITTSASFGTFFTYNYLCFSAIFSPSALSATSATSCLFLCLPFCLLLSLSATLCKIFCLGPLSSATFLRLSANLRHFLLLLRLFVSFCHSQPISASFPTFCFV
jgi:hypothetical protein